MSDTPTNNEMNRDDDGREKSDLKSRVNPEMDAPMKQPTGDGGSGYEHNDQP